MEAFTETMLVNPYGGEQYEEVYEWCIDNGITIRRDGILKLENGYSTFEYAYNKLPTIFEYYYDYDGLKSNNLWDPDYLLELVEKWGPSYTEFFGEMYDENTEFCDMLANKLGYYFRFKGATFTNSVLTTEEAEISLDFINEGVAPLYEDCTVYIGLLDEDYNLVSKYKTDIDATSWMPDEEVTETVALNINDVSDGEYIIAVGLFLDEDDENPTYLLGSSGGTEDNWYVFGEIEISTPDEEYSIEFQNDETIVNNYNSDDYSANINITYLREDSEYVIKAYINDTLDQTIYIDSSQDEYSGEISLDFDEGNNTLSLQIEKDGEVVYEVSKSIYVVSYIDNYSDIAESIIAGYTEFMETYAEMLAYVSDVESQIEELEEYMTNLKDTEDIISEDESAEIMEKHYNLGILLIEAYGDGTLDIEIDILYSMLSDLESIGDIYEDFVTITTSSGSDIDIEDTMNNIESAQENIDSNLDLDGIEYASQFLNISEECINLAETIDSLDDDTTKQGLVNSKNLHSNLLVEWAESLVDAYIEKYIADNPVTIEYSTTDWTNEDVTAIITTNADIEITNNNGSKEYIFTENGEFTFEYTIKGQAFTIDSKVENIDKIAPTITGVDDEKIYTESVTPIISDENLKEITIILNDEELEDYESGTELSEEGLYEITAIDEAGNVTVISFQLIINSDDEYQIQEGIITNISKDTSKTNFIQTLEIAIDYEIYRDSEIIEEDDIIATGDILITQSGDQYTLIVPGDINKDGTVNIKDIVKMRKYLLEGDNLDEVELIAADCNLDGKEISIKDFVVMRMLVLE